MDLVSAANSEKSEIPLKSTVVEVEAVDIAEQVHESAALEESSENDSDSSDDCDTSSRGSHDGRAVQFLNDVALRDGLVPDACTLEEAIAYRNRLHAIGTVAFVEETLDRETISAKKLCTAFNIVPPKFLEGEPDEAYHPLLAIALSREFSRRRKLDQFNSIDDAVRLLQDSKNIIVLTGAGISTSLGIPDFRSKDTGLYSKLEHLGLSDPQEVFDIQIFREDPGIFFSIAKDILPTENKFSPTHGFIKLLQDKGKLLTNYTQNIDNIEANAGVLPEKMVQCHGSFATATCYKCGFKVPGEAIFSDIKGGKIPECSACKQRIAEGSLKPVDLKRKRNSNSQRKNRKDIYYDIHDSSDEDEQNDDIPTPGVMKPDITFFGEDLPDSFAERLIHKDRNLVDLVIVIGTSLKVAPVAEAPGILPRHIPQIYISRTPVSHIGFDIDLLGDCDVIVSELCRRAGWDLQHHMIPADEKVEITLEEGYESRHVFKAI
ncbi:NAD-dependent protein deacetylase h.t1.c1 [Penicillium taxi]|uniref:NAD-dependent protein deacetylase h.t1.c1 n=1 Tax=Penicillium taxi TaxID=168475 RepID=UPI002545AC48|nr:NAD-dependent protein deacetylase h.t1.c1 [Penicillium taxi]KAJ5899136.1 NAD-dependent protein deacetylase h.t1.c1 [Penicillium taxi]